MRTSLAAHPYRTFFLARPRGFGKTLLASTFASLFSKGTQCFQGLKAEALWQERACHRVLRLGFSRLVDFADRSDLENKFKHYLREALAAAGLESPDPTMGSFALMWRRALRLPEPIVLIVDDCDAPITAHLFEPEKLLASQAVLNDFFLGSKRAPGICASRF